MVIMVMQIEGEFPEILPIKESLIKYVFEPNAKQVRLVPVSASRTCQAGNRWQLTMQACMSRSYIAHNQSSCCKH